MECCWFEVFQCLRKVATIGMPVIFTLGSSGQLIFGLVISFGSLGVCARVGPYRDKSDNRLEIICQLDIFVSLLAGLQMLVDRLKGENDFTVMGFVLVACTSVPVVAAFWFILSKAILNKRRKQAKDTKWHSSTSTPRASPPARPHRLHRLRAIPTRPRPPATAESAARGGGAAAPACCGRSDRLLPTTLSPAS